ncbi:MAG TPA: hypothetical protein VJZ00_24315 [Thermoanaerobaculia bacterium]|nr:hypothetical protein [Thermoanaerobaculia bacterium]
MKRAMAVMMVLFASGCASTYVSTDTSLSGGYSEIRLAPDAWRVVFEGNGFTERAVAEKFLLRRAAELSLEQGKRWFVLERHDQWMRQKFTESGVITSPVNEAVVVALDANDGHAFDAAKIIAETDQDAGGRLSEAAKKTLASL